MIKTMKGLRERIDWLIDYEETALAEDHPAGTCAASHKGAIRSLVQVRNEISTVADKLDADKLIMKIERARVKGKKLPEQ